MTQTPQYHYRCVAYAYYGRCELIQQT